MMKKLQLLLEDGKVFVGANQYDELKELLEQQNISYYAFDLSTTEIMVELELAE